MPGTDSSCGFLWSTGSFHFAEEKGALALAWKTFAFNLARFTAVGSGGGKGSVRVSAGPSLRRAERAAGVLR